ncbi:MAG: signal peptidase I, partial [Bacteroidota bacterium]|nr:signal peptidase I [Bacteroidota bacterium]
MLLFTLCIIGIPVNWLFALGYYRLFKASGHPPINALIPVLNTLTIMKILGKSPLNVIVDFIPIINVFTIPSYSTELNKCFGLENKGFDGYKLFLSPSFDNDGLKYLGTLKSLPKNPNAGGMKETFDSILFAVIAATLIRWAFLEAYTIPTPSMEKSLLVGDFLFVSKVHYGPRTPKTPLQVPLTHQTIWGTSIPSYIGAVQIPSFRFPGFSEIKKGDCVVFNWPADQGYPTDLKTNYIKRCVATAGDTIKIINMQLFVNGKPSVNPEKMQYRYFIQT